MREPIPRVERQPIPRTDRPSPRNTLHRLDADELARLGIDQFQFDLMESNLLCFHEPWPETAVHPGQPSMLTFELARTLCRKIFRGSTHNGAASSLGFSRSGRTISQWLALPNEPFLTFQRWLVNAEGMRREMLERRVHVNAATSHDVKDQLGVLGRLYKEDWGAPKEAAPVLLNLSVILQRIEESKATFRDPRMIVEGEIIEPENST